MRKVMFIVACIVGLFVLTGCTTRIGDFTVLSTKNLDLNNPKGFETDINKRLKGRDIRAFGIPNLEEAVDRAIQSEPGCVGLSNAALYIRQGFFTAGYIVVGDPIYIRSSQPASQ